MTPDMEEISKPNNPPPIYYTLVSMIVFGLQAQCQNQRHSLDDRRASFRHTNGSEATNSVDISGLIHDGDCAASRYILADRAVTLRFLNEVVKEPVMATTATTTATTTSTTDKNINHAQECNEEANTGAGLDRSTYVCMLLPPRSPMGRCIAMSPGLVIWLLAQYQAWEPCTPASGDGDVWWRVGWRGGKEGSGATTVQH